MPLTQLEELGFRLHLTLNFFLWPLPVRWKNDYSGMELTKPIKKSIPFALSLTFISFFTVTCLFATLNYSTWNPRPDFDRINSVVLLLLGGCTYFGVVISVEGFSCMEGLIGFQNQILRTFEEVMEGLKALKLNEIVIFNLNII